MRNSNSLPRVTGPDLSKLTGTALRMPRQFLLGVILIFALLAFEMFNFDTTRFALENLLGDVRFAGIAWATILAIAFCAIDFAGLGRLFTPERGRDEPKEIWYLTGAWLLGATMNAVMTWWAVSTVLLGHELGNEVLSREQLLHIVPVFVAILVWLTRILFIGAVTMAGERLLHGQGYPAGRYGSVSGQANKPAAQQHEPRRAAKQARSAQQNKTTPVEPTPVELGATRPSSTNPAGNGQPTRVSRRPPRPRPNTTKRPGYGNVQASGRYRRQARISLLSVVIWIDTRA